MDARLQDLSFVLRPVLSSETFPDACPLGELLGPRDSYPLAASL